MLAAGLLFCGVVLRLVLGSSVLNQIMPYATEGGFWFEKIHPGTFLIVLSAVAALLRSNGLSKFVHAMYTRSARVLIFLVVLALLTLHSAIFQGLSGLAYLLDTLIAPALAVAVLSVSPPWLSQQLCRLIVGFVILNSVVAVGEYVLQMHLLPESFIPGFADFDSSDFRSRAFLDHPLNNALITVTVLPFAIASAGTIIQRAAKGFVLLCALLAFGARAATVTGLVAILIMSVRGVWAQLKRGRSEWLIVGLITAMAFVTILSLIIAITDLGARIFNNAYLDTSAMARFDLFRVFDYLSTSDVLFGIGFDRLQLILLRDKTLPIIENFWVGYVIQFGLVWAVPLAASIIYFLFPSKSHTPMVTLSFLLVASTNNSLATKTPALLICAILIYSAIHVGLSHKRPASVSGRVVRRPNKFASPSPR